MLFQTHHKLIATPDGIFMDDEPLHKCALNTLSERTLFHLLRAIELSAKMTAKDWSSPSPQLAEMQIHLALANPGSLSKDCTNEQRLPNGEWACGDDAPVKDQPEGAGKTSNRRFLSEKEAQKIAREAQAFADQRVPYESGKQDTNGADCSGSVYYIYNKAGYPIPSRESVAGFVGKVKAEKFPFDEIPKGSSPQIGDVIVFQGAGHMGIYAGQDEKGNDLMWAASTTAQAYIKQKIKPIGEVMAYYRYQVADN